MWQTSYEQLEEEKEKLVSLDSIYTLPWIWDCISTLSRESILHFLDLIILNCVGCIFKAVPCLVLFSSSWLCIMNPNLYQSYQNNKGEEQRYPGTGSGHLAQWSCSYLVCPSPWIPPLTENNRRKWMTQGGKCFRYTIWLSLDAWVSILLMVSRAAALTV